MVMNYSHAKVRGPWSISSEDRVETKGRTDGQTDEGDYITCRINEVGNQTRRWSILVDTHSNVGRPLPGAAIQGKYAVYKI